MKKISLCLCASLLLFVSCSESDDKTVASGTTISAPLKNLFSQNTANLEQSFQMNASDNTVAFTSSSGVMLQIDRACLAKNGANVTGAVDFEYIEIFDKGTMLV